MQTPVRLAIVGGRRGGAFARALADLPQTAVLVAICDRNDAVLAAWRERAPEARQFLTYGDLLEWGEFDAVVLATPVPDHAPQALQAIEAGKHVLTEVVAATTLDECWALVEAVERTGVTYMMAENYCYMRPNMMVLHMVRRGLFGEITHAEGAYIHDTRDLAFTPEGELTWRGKLHRRYNRNRYPTHSLGPVAQWLGILREGGDAFESTATFVSNPVNLRRYAAERFGADHPAASPNYWQQGDSSVSLIRTVRGALIVLRVDSCSPRPHNMTHYALQGSTASYLSARHGGEDPLIWIEGRSPGKSPTWEPLWRYADEFEHPRWRRWGEQARRAGHGGGDFFVLADFVDAVRRGVPPPIDVYDAVTWSSIVPLSELSVARGGAPVAVPDFARGRRRPWEPIETTTAGTEGGSSP
ncbi:MAG TPA: Gfo/Idh/MocA family oxidoreductase [Limnochordia bacterium]